LSAAGVAARAAKPVEELIVGGEMTAAAEADVTEALTAATTTAGSSKRFQCTTSSPGVAAAEFFFYLILSVMRGICGIADRIIRLMAARRMRCAAG
jgi:hypothetical protein